MSVVGDRYAESLFDLAKEENQVTQYLDDIKLVGEVLDSDPQIVQFFNHVLIENDKKKILKSLFKVKKYIEDNKIDIIHAHGVTYEIFGSII